MQFKSIYSEDAIAELQKRLKEPVKSGLEGGGDDSESSNTLRENLLDIAVNEGGRLSSNQDSLKFYGDQMYFEWRVLRDRATNKVTIDNRFQARAEFSLSDQVTLRMHGHCSNKNKSTLCFLYPTLRYLHGNT